MNRKQLALSLIGLGLLCGVGAVFAALAWPAWLLLGIFGAACVGLGVFGVDVEG